MHKISEHAGDDAKKKAADRPPCGPGFDEKTVAQTARLEVWGTNFSDPGPDYCQFRVFDATGKQCGVRNVDGY